MDTVAPTTELEAVNTMLSIIGESPVNTLEDNGVVDAVTAQSILNHANRELQTKGWHFNTEPEYRLVADFDGNVYLPTNCLKVDTAGKDKDLDLVSRGTQLYDRKNHSFNIGRTVTVDMVVGLPFHQLPESARRYVVIRAGRIFQDRILGSDTLNAWTTDDELWALVELKEAELDTADANMFTDSYSVSSVLRR